MFRGSKSGVKNELESLKKSLENDNATEHHGKNKEPSIPPAPLKNDSDKMDALSAASGDREPIPPPPDPPKPQKSSRREKKKAPVVLDIKPPKMKVKRKEESEDVKSSRIMESEIDKLFQEVLKNKEKISEILALRKEVELLKKGMDSLKREVKKSREDIEDMVRSETDGMEKNLEKRIEAIPEIQNSIKEIRASINSLSGRMNDIEKRSEEIKGLDIPGLKRDVEALKEKSRWLEESVEAIDMKRIMDMMKEVENRIESLRVSSPLVIE